MRLLGTALMLNKIYLVSVVFGTAIPTSLYIFGKCFQIYMHVLHITVLCVEAVSSHHPACTLSTVSDWLIH